MTPEWIEGRGMTSKRTRMRMIERLQTEGIRSEPVLETMASIPRHIFVDEAMAHLAYEDSALPIGYGQTISQPYIVARMTELLLSFGHLKRVLEVGTGCGYQTTVLSKLVDQVYTVERLGILASKATSRWHALSLNNIHSFIADGFQGLKSNAPYDGIIVTACASELPTALLEQLAPGGVLVIPIGDVSGTQQLYRYHKSGVLQSDGFEFVRFVPLIAGVEGIDH